MADRLTSRGIIRRTQRWYSFLDDDADGPLPPPGAAAFNPAPFADAWGDQRTVPPVAAAWSTIAATAELDADAPQVTRLWPITGDGYALGTNTPDALWNAGAFSGEPDRYNLLSPSRVTGRNRILANFGTGVSGDDVLIATFVSPPLRGTQRIAGSFRSLFGVQEELATDEFRPQIVIRVMDTNGITVRGVLYAGDAGGLTNEFSPANLSSLVFPQGGASNAIVLLTPVDAVDGDRIVIEVGFRQHSTSTGEGDLDVNATVADFVGPGFIGGRPWVEFSQPLTFRSELDAATFYDAQTFVSNAVRWFAEDASFDGFVPIVAAGFDPATVDWGWDAASDLWRPARWFQTETDGDVPSLLPNAWAGAEIGWDAQRDLWLPTRWFQPDTEAWVDIPNLTVATVDQLSELWLEQPGQERSLAVRWYQPEDATEALYPTLPAPSFDPSLMDFGRDAQTDRSIQPVWFRPDDDMRGIPPFNPTTATVAQDAGLWQDQSGQQDRGIQPVWWAPDAEAQLMQSLAPPPTVATVPEQSPLWIEQPYPLKGTAQFWYSQGNEPVEGPLQSWLFTTGSPGGGFQPVLIDATSGDVYLGIGGPFIVPTK